MRRLMTGYAMVFNRRYQRNGHLFQNRYKSVICDKEPYFLELIRYIHLNPIRAGVVKDLSELDRYPWTGHSALMGYQEQGWQEVGEVLGCFSQERDEARRAYRGFMQEGVDQGRRKDLYPNRWVGSGEGEQRREVYDERVLGKRGFVEKVLREASGGECRKLASMTLSEIIERVTKLMEMEKEELLTVSKKKEVTQARAMVSYLAAKEMGYRYSEIGKALRVHPVTVARSLENGKKVFDKHKEVWDKAG